MGALKIFDQVVVTTAAPLAAQICSQLSAKEKGTMILRDQGIICASLLLKHPLSGFGITNITDSRVPYTAVIEMSALVERSYSLVVGHWFTSPSMFPRVRQKFNLTDAGDTGRVCICSRANVPSV